MKKIPVFFIALCCAAGVARASPVLFHPGTGVPNVIGGSRDAFWSEPPDLNGLIASSEQILAFGLETEIANDFQADGSLSHVTWWGGYYNNSTPCQSGMTTPGFNVRVYYDALCSPGTIIADLSVWSVGETAVGCQSGVYPLFRWDVDCGVGLTVGHVYWLGLQMKDHAYPPQSGRLASGGVVGCESMFRSAYFGYPDWTPAVDVFGVQYDASQEVQCYGIGSGGDQWGACCLDGGQCSLMYGPDCEARGGSYQGLWTTCSPQNPCEGLSEVSEGRTVTKKSASWGEIKSLYR